MSKIFPIKVERVAQQEYKIAEWMLHNLCNYDCSFCPPKFKGGSQRWLDIETYKNTCKRIINEANNPVWFKFTGGEPTLFPKLPELLKFIKDNGSFTYIISNGSRTMRYWKEIKELNALDFLALTFHPEQTDDLAHIIEVVNLFQDTETLVTVNITCVPKFFDKAVEAHREILEKCATISTLQQINDVEHMDKYTDEQKAMLLSASMEFSPRFSDKKLPSYDRKYYFNDGKLKYTYSDGSTEIDDNIKFIKRNMTYFKGWECDIGLELIRIDYETIFRAVCEQGGSWSIYDDHMFAKTSIICDTDKPCVCGLDIEETKRR